MVQELFNQALDYLKFEVYPRFFEIISTPFTHQEMFWIVTPLVITLFLIQLYFGRHKEEEMGWNTAYGNAVVLIFVVVHLLRYLYQQEGMAIFTLESFLLDKTLLVLIIAVQAFTLLLIDFTHLLPKNVSFFLSNSVSVTVTAFVVIVLVYSTVPLDKLTFITAIMFFFLAYAFFEIFKFLVPPTEHAEEHMRREAANERDKRKELERIAERGRKTSEANEDIEGDVKKFGKHVKKIFK